MFLWKKKDVVFAVVGRTVTVSEMELVLIVTVTEPLF